MEVIAEEFPNYSLNKIDSALNKRYTSIDHPNGCYLQAVRSYSRTAYAFAKERRQLYTVPDSGRCYADLGKRFQHPYVLDSR